MQRIGTLIVFSLLAVCCHAAPTSPEDMESFRSKTVEQVDQMPGIPFESYVCALLESRGYSVENIRASNDFGVDAIATKGEEKISIQIKRSSRPISRRAISDAVAGKVFYRCNRAMVITNSTLTKPAKVFAKGSDCDTVERAELLVWIEEFKQGTNRPGTKMAE